MEKIVKRIDYIDILKGLAMILVVVGHIAFISSDTHKYIYSFHMPLFFVCYGLTYKSKKYDSKTIKQIVLSKIKRIYIPFIFWALFFSSLTIENFYNILYGSHKSLTFCTNSHLWFMPCFLVSTLLFELLNAIFYRINLNNKTKRLFLTLAIPICVFASVMLPVSSIKKYPFNFNVALMGLAFIILGYFIKILIKYFRIRHLHLGVLILIFIILLLETLTYKLNNIYYVSMADNFYGNVFYFLLTAVSASLAMIILSIILDKILFKKMKKALIFIGQNTIATIAIHHTIILWLEEVTTTYYNHFSLPNSLIIGIITILTLIISCIVVSFINYFIPELNGKKQAIKILSNK